jgi:predicted enzyme related to lactoylglutathione lyase
MKKVINWFEIPAVDLDRAASFWETVLDMKMKRESAPGSEMAIFPYGDAATGGMLVRRGGKPATVGTMVYLDAKGDLDGALVRAERAGGRVAVPKTDIGKDGLFAIVVDSEGNAVGLHTPRE